MSARLLEHDPVTGLTEYFHYDPMTGDVVVETMQDVEGILDANKKLQNNDSYSSAGIKDGMWHYARVPLVVQLRWLNEYGLDNWPLKQGNEKLLFKLLNSPEWKYLKATGKIHAGR